jgi:hypothetical protein
MFYLVRIKNYLAEIYHSSGQTSWSHSSPYLQPPQNASVFASPGSQEMPSNHESAHINLASMPKPVDPVVVLHEPTTSSNTLIGSMYSTDSHDSYIFKCHNKKRVSLTFGRWYDFKRHFNRAHPTAPTVYWCDFEGCARSRGAGDRPFTRKDKVKDHIDSVHGEGIEVWEGVNGEWRWVA